MSHLDVRNRTAYGVSVGKLEGQYMNLSIRLTPEQVAKIDEIVERRSQGPVAVSRASLVRYWVERGLTDEGRKR